MKKRCWNCGEPIADRWCPVLVRDKEDHTKVRQTLVPLCGLCRLIICVNPSWVVEKRLA